ncbi:hypothetical protein SUGI_1159960 [Cryptomeria japonica]|uniref:uncharacterized protein At1g76070 n=1 Tax=Cryptomeria japonica TaxID=3369 RepID=UPI0024149BD4|nr:uncharacterized protein At1g76070 [Cryptomeria japonica]GLJ54143.1 hypothetical protein SUGI_1159960 [Cryptomeria japonica]
MTLSLQFAAQRNWRGSQCEDEEGEASESFEKATKKISKDSGSRRFIASIIGLPKRPDTKFRKGDFSARLRSSISRKCKRSTAPLFSAVPREAMGNSKGSGNSFKIYDPGSPDVSCLGRIKLKQKNGVKLKAIGSNGSEGRRFWSKEGGSSSSQRQGRLSWIKKLFSFSSKRKTQVQVHGSNRTPVSQELPSQTESFSPRLSYSHVSQLKRFNSQREPDALSNFSADDVEIWAQESAEEACPNESWKEDEEFEGGKKPPAKEFWGEGEEEEEEDQSDVSLSSPQPAVSEINLWKRRSVAPPRVLELNKRYAFDTRRPVTV